MNTERKNEARRTANGVWAIAIIAGAGGAWFAYDTMSQRQAVEAAQNASAAARLVQRTIGPKCEAAYPDLRPAIVYAEHGTCCNTTMSLCRKIPQ